MMEKMQAEVEESEKKMEMVAAIRKN